MLSLQCLATLLFILIQSGVICSRSNAFTTSSLTGGRINYFGRRGARHLARTSSSVYDSTGGDAPDSPDDPLSSPVRFLGKGANAIVRPGVILVAPAHEASHFLMNSAVFVHAVGTAEHGEHVTRGVIVDHPTAFTMGEMAGGSVYGSLAQNILFRGGDAGRDMAMLLHSRGGDAVECGDMIGTSGIYEGGLQAAMDAAEDGLVDPEEFKFFFNYVEFTDRQLEQMLSEVDSEGDAWMSVEVPPEMVLDGDFDRGEAWKYIRNQIAQMGIE